MPRATKALPGLVLMLILGGLQALMPTSIDLYLPSLPTIAKDLAVSAGDVQFTLAVYLFGSAIGQIVYGALTDTYGRKKPLLAGYALYCVGTVICASSYDIDTLIIGRLVQALGAAAAGVITSAIARDLWSGAELAHRLSTLMMILGAAPVLAPSLGGFILLRWDWHGLFWFLTAFGLLSGVAVTFLPETSAPETRTRFHLGEMFTNFGALLKNPQFVFYMLTSATAGGMLLTYVTSSSFIYIDMLGVTPSQFAIFFGINACGFVTASTLNRMLLKRFELHQIAATAVGMVVTVGALLLAVANLGWTSLPVLTVLFALQALSVGLVFPNLGALTFGAIDSRFGSASALSGTTQSIIGSLAGALVGSFSHGAFVPVTVIILGFAVCSAGAYALARRAHRVAVARQAI
jgi:MFS transporter, DHA1 family, multidrug resistance protein